MFIDIFVRSRFRQSISLQFLRLYIFRLYNWQNIYNSVWIPCLTVFMEKQSLMIARHKDTKLHKNKKKDEQQCGSDLRLGGQGSLNSLNLKTPGIYFGAKKGLWIHLFSLNSLNFLEFSLNSFWVFHEKRIC